MYSSFLFFGPPCRHNVLIVGVFHVFLSRPISQLARSAITPSKLAVTSVRTKVCETRTKNPQMVRRVDVNRYIFYKKFVCQVLVTPLWLEVQLSPLDCWTKITFKRHNILYSIEDCQSFLQRRSPEIYTVCTDRQRSSRTFDSDITCVSHKETKTRKFIGQPTIRLI